MTYFIEFLEIRRSFKLNLDWDRPLNSSIFNLLQRLAKLYQKVSHVDLKRSSEEIIYQVSPLLELPA